MDLVTFIFVLAIGIIIGLFAGPMVHSGGSGSGGKRNFGAIGLIVILLATLFLSRYVNANLA